MKSIYWLRTDLRINDNLAFNEFLNSSDELLIVFAQTKSFKCAGPIRKKFILECFESLKICLEKNGVKVFKTDLPFFDYLVQESSSEKISSLYFTNEYAFDERQEELHVLDFCDQHKISAFSFDQGTLIKKNDLPFSIENMPFVFTDFRKKVEADLRITPLTNGPFTQIQNQGLSRIQHYLWETHRIQTYKETRNGLLNFDDSSKLSPWLNSGTISPREVYFELKRYETQVCANESTYWLFFELLWRDYFKFVAVKY